MRLRAALLLVLLSLWPQSTALRWIYSYAALSFDTPSQELEEGQFARYDDAFAYRPIGSSKENESFRGTEREQDVVGLTEVQVRPGQFNYFHVFDNPLTGDVFYQKITEQEYKALDVPNPRTPTKSIIKIGGWWPSANAAIAFATATGAASAGGASSLTYSHTVTAGSNLELTVGATLSDDCAGSATTTISSITYASVTMTSVTDLAPVIGSCGGTAFAGRVSQQRLEAPATGANNVVVTLAAALCAACTIQSVASDFSGVDQTTPITASNTAGGDSTAATVTVASPGSTDVLIDQVCNGTTVTSVGANQTERNRVDTNNSASCNNRGASTQSGADGGVMSWTVGSDIWIISAVSLKAATGGGVTCRRNLLMFGAGC